MIVPITPYLEAAGIVPTVVCEVESILQVTEFARAPLVTTKVWNAASGVNAIA
jgi:hypothetical protein